MAQAGCYQSIQVCAVRVNRLSSTGAPLTGAGTTNGYIAKAPITVKFSPNYENGVELKLMNGCGTLASYYRAPDQLKNYNISFTLTDLDHELIEILTDEPVVTVSGSTVGHTAKRVASCSTGTRNGVAIEFWSKQWNACAAPTGNQYWHWFMPRAILQTGEITLENDYATIPVEGYLQENPNFGFGGWTSAAWPSSAGSLQSLLGVVSESVIPTASCGYQAVS